MSPSRSPLRELLAAKEDEHLEFKEASQSFHFEKLVKYCAALANEGGGAIVLGVTDARPRRVVGSQAFSNLERTKAGLVDKLRLRVEVEEHSEPEGRVVVFRVPARPIGVPIAVDGAYWMRAGEDLVPMTADMLRRIFDEACPDFSAEICPGATMADLDPAALDELRGRWLARSQNQALRTCSPERLLRDAELMDDQGITYAALVLLGTHAALGRHLAQAEVVFEYRSSPSPGPANQREEFRQGFLLYYDRLWELIDLRNDQQHFQDGMIMHAVPTFSEAAVREAILNAVSHRDYRHPGSIFVRQFSRRVEIVSPGGFPPGITPENILDHQQPRNRRIAEVLARCGWVERSGQGADRMLEECVRQGKRLPDYGQSDSFQVWLNLHGEVLNDGLLRVLEWVGQDQLRVLDPHDFLLLGLVANGMEVPKPLRLKASQLLSLEVLERTGRGKLILSKKHSGGVGWPVPARRKGGLAREQQKARVLDLIGQQGAEGVPMRALLAALPSLDRNQVRSLLESLRREGRVHPAGVTRTVRWHLGIRGGLRGGNAE